MYSPPLAYFITFTTYGTWLHGDERGSVERGGVHVDENNRRVFFEQSLMKHAPVILTAAQRRIVDETVRRVAQYRGWRLDALNVRTNHVHSVISGDDSGTKILADLKSWSTRELRQRGEFETDAEIWTAGGSAIPRFTEEEWQESVYYVNECQDKKR